MQFCIMEKLNFPDFDFSIKSKENKPYILDVIRKKWLVLTPEEWVRQHCIHYLIEVKKYPLGQIQVEKKIKINNTLKRYDLVVFNHQGRILLLAECKAPRVNISQKAFDQIARYNMVLKSQYLMISNGHHHYFCQIDFENKKYHFLKELPPFKGQNS
jgi:hypothetical protein